MISLQFHDYIATIEFQRPEKKNALTLALWVELKELVEEAIANENSRALILRATGDDFCAGADIGEFDSVRKDTKSALAYEAANSAAFRAIRECPFPTVAAINGTCFGGGFGIAAACDLRFGEPDSRFCVPPAKLGLAYPVDAMADIIHALGAQRAKYLAFTANIIDATAAMEYGFLLDIYDRDELHQRCETLAAQISNVAPLSNRATKAAIQSVQTGDELDFEAAVKLGNTTFTSQDYMEGRAAFREKRKPKFHGK